jgi:hypothetical protein
MRARTDDKGADEADVKQELGGTALGLTNLGDHQVSTNRLKRDEHHFESQRIVSVHPG